MNKNLKYIFIIPALVSPLIIGCNPNQKVETVDFALLRDNYKKMLKESTSISAYKDKTKEEIYKEFTVDSISGIETFKFNDINYDGPFSRSVFPPRKHLDRALQIAIVADERNDADLKDYVRKLEYNWVFNNYKSPNWYENEIGTIRSLTNVAMFEYDDLNDKGKEAFKGKVRNASIYYHPGLEKHQGANLMDYALNTFKSGILAKDKNETDCAFNRLMDEIKEDDLEGFQSEGSYFQHGRLLSTGSYGNVATSKVGEFFTTLKGSNYVVPQNKLKIILNCILVGLKYMIQREYRSWMCEGRGFCDENPYKYNSNAIKNYLDIDGVSEEDKENLKSFISNLDNGEPCFHDTKVFPKARAIVSNINDVYIAFKGCDPTTVNTECLNNENELAYNLSYGMNTCIMQSGLEYVNLSPVCNFSFMPGGISKDYGSNEDGSFTTEGDTALFSHIKELANERFEDKVASVDDDGNKYIYGMADDLNNSGIACCYQKGKHSNKLTFKGQTFTVSCFSTPEGMAILGAGLKDLDDSSSARYVTLQQAVIDKNNDIVSSVDTKTVKHNYKNTKKIIDTSVYYKSLNDKEVILKTPKDVKGDFKRNHSTYSGTTEPVKDVMMAYMSIDANNKYAYSIQTEDKKIFDVACNSEDIQAVVYKDKIAACFYNKDPEEQTFSYGGKSYTLEKEFVEGEGAFQIFEIKK